MASDQLSELMQALKFDESDLTENRNKKLSPKQKRRLYKRGYYSMVSALTLVVIVIIVLALLAQNSADQTTELIIVGVIFIAIPLITVYQKWREIKSVEKLKVAPIEGAIAKSIARGFQTIHHTSHEEGEALLEAIWGTIFPEYNLHIDKKRFKVNRRAYNICDKRQNYRIYYIRKKNEVVAIEPLIE
jgi:apolipoprotein N-acyltransferase